MFIDLDDKDEFKRLSKNKKKWKERIKIEEKLILNLLGNIWMNLDISWTRQMRKIRYNEHLHWGF